MIELDEMAELVDDEIVGEMGREEDDFVIKVQIAPTRTAPPTRLLITDAHATICERAMSMPPPLHLREIFKPTMRERPRRFLVHEKRASAAAAAARAALAPPHTTPPRCTPATSHDSSDYVEERHMKSVKLTSSIPRRGRATAPERT